MMNPKNNKPAKTSNPAVASIGKVFAWIAALAGATLLIVNIVAFADAVKYYLAMGYPSAEVLKQLIPSQLLPGIFEPIAVYGGVALLLFWAGAINQKVSECLSLLTATGVDNEVGGEDAAEESESNGEESAAEPAIDEEEEPAETNVIDS